KDCAAHLAELTASLERLVVLCRAGTSQGRDALKAEASLAALVLKTTEDGRDQARQALRHTRVSAPMDGLVICRVKVGDSVQAGDRSATLLATIVQADAVHVAFAVDEATYFSYLGRAKRKETTSIALAPGQTDKDFSISGKIIFVDNQTDPSKGSTLLHAAFDDASGKLLEA